MHPEILGYPAFLVILPFALAFGLVPFVWGARREGLPFLRLALVIVVVTVAGLTGGKLYSIVERGGVTLLDFELSNGFRYPGAIIGMVVSLPLLMAILPPGLSVWDLLDLLAPSIGIAMVVIRVHCLLSGCCAGSVCHHFWCISFPNGSPPFQHQMIDGLVLPSAPASQPVHPLQVYFMASSLAAALLALWFRKHAHYAGQTFLVFLAAHETGKFLLEFLRYPPAPLVQAGSMLIGAAAIIALLGYRRLDEPAMQAAGPPR